MDINGNLIWQKSLGGTANDDGYSIVATTDGGYILAGDTYSNNGDVSGNNGEQDYWVVKIDGTGAILWQKALGGTFNDQANIVIQAVDGTIVVAGESYSTNCNVTSNNGSEDYWVVNLSATGTLIWQKSLGGTGIDYASGLYQATDGGFLVTGATQSNNGDVTGNHGGYDFWIVKLTTSTTTSTSSQIITTVAGTGSANFSGDGGTATSATLNLPYALATDAAGNLYIADRNNHRIRKVATDGTITTIAGNNTPGFSGDGGTATAASLLYPYAVTVDKLGNLFIADWGNHRIRKIATNGIITTVAGNGLAAFSGDGNAATSASLNNPTGVSVDAVGNIFIADYGNNRIRKVDANNIITTVAGNGSAGFSGDGGLATSASLNNPYDVINDAIGNLYIADFLNHRIRKVATDGIITTVVGKGIIGNGNGSFSGDGGAATAANIHGPTRVTLDSIGNFFIADYANQRIRRVNNSGIISTVAGNGVASFGGDGGLATSAQINSPTGVAVDKFGNLFIADLNNNRIRKVSNSVLPLTLLAFNGQKQNSSINLHWTTANEINTASFTIQRSTDGVDFTGIGSVAANGYTSSKTAYAFTDAQSNGSKNYYRLKMIDKDGNFTYSSVLAFTLQETATITFKLSPNPAKTYVQLQINSKKDEPVNIVVFDAAGKTVISQKSSVNIGTNVITINNINTLKSGLYMVQMIINGEASMQKLIVNK